MSNLSLPKSQWTNNSGATLIFGLKANFWFWLNLKFIQYQINVWPVLARYGKKKYQIFSSLITKLFLLRSVCLFIVEMEYECELIGIEIEIFYAPMAGMNHFILFYFSISNLIAVVVESFFFLL